MTNYSDAVNKLLTPNPEFTDEMKKKLKKDTKEIKIATSLISYWDNKWGGKVEIMPSAYKCQTHEDWFVLYALGGEEIKPQMVSFNDLELFYPLTQVNMPEEEKQEILTNWNKRLEDYFNSVSV